MKQITIFDVLESIEGKKTDVPCGYIDDLLLIGRELKFQELKNMIGKKCILTYATESHTWYKVIRITEYFENSDKVFRKVRDIPEGHLQYEDCINEYIHDVVGDKESMDCYEIDHICDRVGFVDQDKLKKVILGYQKCTAAEVDGIRHRIYFFQNISTNWSYNTKGGTLWKTLILMIRSL